jgi:hypothetical protein
MCLFTKPPFVILCVTPSQLIDDLGIVEMAVPDAVFGGLKAAPSKVPQPPFAPALFPPLTHVQVGALDRFKK